MMDSSTGSGAPGQLDPKDSSGKTAALKTAPGTSGAVPLTSPAVSGSYVVAAGRVGHKSSPAVPIWVVIAGVAAAILVVVAIIYALATNSSNNGTTNESGGPDTSFVPGCLEDLQNAPPGVI